MHRRRNFQHRESDGHSFVVHYELPSTPILRSARIRPGVNGGGPFIRKTTGRTVHFR